MSYVAPWAGATALAVCLSWLGVRDVVRSAVSERSAPPPIVGPVIHASPTTPPTAVSPTSVPSPADDEGRDRKAGGDPAPKPSPSASSAPARPPGNVRSYSTRGGRAAMSISGGKVRLVSAVPNPGYETKVTSAEGWLRVDFIGGERSSSVIASWYEHAPKVRVYEY